MAKRLIDLFILVALFAPLLFVVCLASRGFSIQVSLLELGGGWQALFLFCLILPVLALGRLRLLKVSSDVPNLME